ncbi:hypothetical protein [Chengkuizengella sediminis]|uniref:hypothetical protein n=1 Tax=Chengkuizengella sediminis TaxID=1885917 RepID=UPI001389E770|nr:hypothetical protein [Chengkuizengella sediminis]NDI35615.1 hypothetical protein [Chengkuizengella sediminis]
MNLNSKDLTIIEQALNEAIHHCGGYQNSLNYREVLSKLQSLSKSNDQLNQEVTSHDGFRYDYDDSK